MLSGHSLGDASGRLLAVDPQICEILHQREEELLGKTFRDFTHPEDLARNNRLVEALRPGGGPIEFTKRYVRPDGSTVFVKVRLSRFEEVDGGRLIGTIETLVPPVAKRWEAAKRAAAGLRRRRLELGDDLFGDIAYELLLETYLAETEGRSLALEPLTRRVGATATVMMRWLRVLANKGLIELVPGANGAPQLTLEGVRTIERLLDVTDGE